MCSACHKLESGPLTKELYCSCGMTSGGVAVECLAGVTPFVACGTIDGVEDVLVAEKADLLKMAQVVSAKRVGLWRDLIGGVTLGAAGKIGGGEALTMPIGIEDDGKMLLGGRGNTA